MTSHEISLGNCRFEVLIDASTFVGLGRIWIGSVLVRSGRLPIRPATQSFTGLELCRMEMERIEETDWRVRIATRAVLRRMPVGLMRDHSFDPIHDTADWDADAPTAEGKLDLVLELATDNFNGVAMSGFSYHYEYDGAVPLFYLLDRASWELDGDIAGATVVSQSSCSAPVVTFAPETAWTTEGLIHWDDPASKANPVMTHNLPRWASHQAFDFQYKGSRTLVGVFDRVGLIRSILCRQAQRAELKTFDKHIFDQAARVATPAKRIMLNDEPKGEVDQRNLWTWVIQEVHDRARAEFGLTEEPMLPWVSQNYWENFNFDTYFKDLIPAAAAIGARGVFIDNVHKSAMTENCPNPPVFHWNMCCGHEYEVAPRLGGPGKLKDLVDRCGALGIEVFSWTNNDQALSSPLNASERDEQRQWYVKLEDTRQKYGGAYAGCMSVWDFKSAPARQNWIDSLKRTHEQTGLSEYLFDSFYNLAFMPINYSFCEPKTMWRELVQAFKELQDAGIHFKIESFGPFGCVQHGCPTSYNIDNLFACYKVGLGSGYTTVPTDKALKDTLPGEAHLLYYVLAHMTNPGLQLFAHGKRIDMLWMTAHRRALADYNENYRHMHRRYLQEGGRAVIWHDQAGKAATIWNFAPRDAALPGRVKDVTTGKDLPQAATYRLEACHTYRVTDASELPVTL